MRDAKGRVLAQGDPVTVSWGQDRNQSMTGAHGTVVSFGTKRVRVRLTKSLVEMDHGREESFLPEHLEHGHRGDPRPQDKMPELMLEVRRGPISEAAKLAVDAGIITARQAKELIQMWHDHTEPQTRKF